MMTTLQRTAFALAVAVIAAAPARADDSDTVVAEQKQVNAEIEVIRTTGATPSTACLAALQEMHTAEQQLAGLNNDPTNAPSGSALAENEQGELAVGRDVFASDMDTAASACRADAAQGCAGPQAGRLAKSCAIVARMRH